MPAAAAATATAANEIVATPSSAPSSPAPFAPGNGWARAFQDLSREHGFEPLRVEGRLPPELDGTLYRTGPSLFATGGRPYRHWFDGDGAVSSVRFARGTAQGAVRLVQSRGLVAERKAGRPLHGGYGTVPPGLRRFFARPKNAANTAMLAWGKRLFALFEAGLPTELAPDDLTTIGETDLGGVVPQAFSAHPHAVPARDTRYNFGVRYGRRTMLDLFELGGGGGSGAGASAGKARCIATVPLAGATMIHDFVATERHLVFFAPPLRLQVARLLLGRAAYSDALAWRPAEGTEVIVVPIDDPSRVVRFTVEPFYQWHFANAFERGDEIVVDYVRYPDFESNAWVGSLVTGQAHDARLGTLHRATISAARGTLRSEERASVNGEFPRVAPAVEGRPHQWVYVAAHARGTGARHGLQQELAKIDAESGATTRVALGREQYPGEPIFVPRPGGSAEDDGWLVTLVYDAHAHASHVAVLDAQRLEAGPLARAWFDHHIPFTFHGTFV